MPEPADLSPVLSGANAEALDLMRREAAAFRWLHAHPERYVLRRPGGFQCEVWDERRQLYFMTDPKPTALEAVESAMSADRTRQAAGGEGRG